jgi:hypothetical protein
MSSSGSQHETSHDGDKPTDKTPGASSASTPHPHAVDVDVSGNAQEIISGLWDSESDEPIDDQAALRWRQALLRLSETFLDAAEERRDLSPILLGALHNALEELLIRGNEEDLMALEDWLGHEAPPPPPIQEAVSEAARAIFSGTDRRNMGDRRSGNERRQGDRRQSPHGRRAADTAPHAS